MEWRFITHTSWRRYTTPLEGPHREGVGGPIMTQRVSGAGPGAYGYIRSVHRMLWYFQPRPDSSIQTFKSGGVESFQEIYSRERAWEVGESLPPGHLREVNTRN